MNTLSLRTAVILFLLMALAGAFCPSAKGASLETTRAPLHLAEPELILNTSRGAVKTRAQFEVKAVGFPWDLSRALRLSFLMIPDLPMQFQLDLTEKVVWSGGGIQYPIGERPKSEQCFKTLRWSSDFRCALDAVGRWENFTEPGKQYALKSESVAAFKLLGLVDGEIKIEHVGTIDLSLVIPPPIHIEVGGKYWKPRCISSKPFWDGTFNQCRTCDPNTQNGGDCDTDNPEEPPPGDPENCFSPNRMLFDPVSATCSCRPEYPARVYFYGLLINCLSEHESTQVSDTSVVDRARGVGGGRTGVTIYFNCVRQTYILNEAFHDPFTGDITVSHRREVEVRCSLSFYPIGNLTADSPLAEKLIGRREACFSSESGLGWVPCPNDPTPNLPIDYPRIDLAADLPHCQSSLRPEWCDELNLETESSGSEPPDGTPDMVIATSYLHPPAPYAGEKVHFAVVLSNLGGAQAASHLYRVQIVAPDGTVYETDRFTGSFVADSSRQLSVDSTVLGYPALQPGEHQFTLMADSLDEIHEIDESNNTITGTFHVTSPPTGGPDLRISAIEPRDSIPGSGERLTVELTVSNSGDQPAGASEAQVTITSSGQLDGGIVQVPPLAAGAHTMVSFTTAGPVPPGLLTVDVHADEHAQISEVDEANNRTLMSFEVSDSGLGCLPCTTGSPDNQIGDQLCFDSDVGPPGAGLVMTCRGVRGDGTTCSNDPNNPNGWENTGPQCDDPQSLPPGWHANRCGEPGICPGPNT